MQAWFGALGAEEHGERLLKRHRRGRECSGDHSRERGEKDRDEPVGQAWEATRYQLIMAKGQPGLRGPVVSVGPAEPTDILLVLIGVHSSAVRGYNVFTLSAPACSGRSPSTWSLPDFCLFLSTFLSLPFLLLSVFLLSSLFFNHLFASLSLSSSWLAFPGPPLCGSGCKTHTTKAVSSHVWPWPRFCIYITPALSLLCLCSLLGLLPSSG